MVTELLAYYMFIRMMATLQVELTFLRNIANFLKCEILSVLN